MYVCVHISLAACHFFHFCIAAIVIVVVLVDLSCILNDKCHFWYSQHNNTHTKNNDDGDTS